jgi:hypothetical protein
VPDATRPTSTWSRNATCSVSCPIAPPSWTLHSSSISRDCVVFQNQNIEHTAVFQNPGIHLPTLKRLCQQSEAYYVLFHGLKKVAADQPRRPPWTLKAFRCVMRKIKTLCPQGQPRRNSIQMIRWTIRYSRLASLWTRPSFSNITTLPPLSEATHERLPSI